MSDHSSGTDLGYPTFHVTMWKQLHEVLHRTKTVINQGRFLPQARWKKLFHRPKMLSGDILSIVVGRS